MVECPCENVPCPNPVHHPVHRSAQSALGGSFLVLCLHECPADECGSMHDGGEAIDCGGPRRPHPAFVCESPPYNGGVEG